MKAWVINNSFGHENLEIVERPAPGPGKEEANTKVGKISTFFVLFLSSNHFAAGLVGGAELLVPA